MRASTAYFAGAGTVIVAIVGGIGGGLLFADIVSPKTPKVEQTRLEQRMSAEPIQVKAGAEPGINPATPPAPTTAAAPTVPVPPAAQAEATAAPAATPPTDTMAASQATAPVVEPAGPVPPVAQKQTDIPSSQPPAQKQAEDPPVRKQAAASPEDAVAKAKDIEVKRTATEKRRSERRPQWSEKRRYQRRDDPERELREVEAKVREETEAPGFFGTEPVRSDGRRIRIIDLD